MEDAAASYEADVPKANREWICKDSLSDYNSDEREQVDKVMWGDIGNVG